MNEICPVYKGMLKLIIISYKLTTCQLLYPTNTYKYLQTQRILLTIKCVKDITCITKYESRKFQILCLITKMLQKTKLEHKQTVKQKFQKSNLRQRVAQWQSCCIFGQCLGAAHSKCWLESHISFLMHAFARV